MIKFQGGNRKSFWKNKLIEPFILKRTLLLRLPVGRGGVKNSPRSIFLGFFSVSQVGLPLMGDTAVHCCLSHDFWTQFLAEYVAKTHNLTCILQHLSSKKVVRAKIRIQNVLWRQIPPRSFRQGRWIAVMYMSWESHMQRSIRIQFVNILILYST